MFSQPDVQRIEKRLQFPTNFTQVHIDQTQYVQYKCDLPIIKGLKSVIHFTQRRNTERVRAFS